MKLCLVVVVVCLASLASGFTLKKAPQDGPKGPEKQPLFRRQFTTESSDEKRMFETSSEGPYSTSPGSDEKRMFETSSEGPYSTSPGSFEKRKVGGDKKKGEKTHSPHDDRDDAVEKRRRHRQRHTWVIE
ncbi:uncharacterized protein LOC110449737 [Mizuhopecten yessoensis]|uniref:uncharacterized protein LOC110449737 n=1 Tax=Mizuhopecten yessoensis TaxID=6573 RepID=UPI000B4577F3|nr:uncharacterized protein LOC110449737 [Mizuhopecten yessoensis]